MEPFARTPEQRAAFALERELADDEIALIASHLGALRTRLEAAPRILWRRIRLTADNNPVDLKAPTEEFFHSVLVENPNAAAGQIVEVGFAPGDGLPGKSVTRVPRQTGKLIPAHFEVVSIGIDPASIAGGATVFVARFDQLLPPTAYAFTP